MRTLLIRTLLAAVLATPLAAQTLGEIAGEVKDPSGAATAGASVTATNTATGGVRNTTTNDQGLFNFPSLVPGQYTVKVNLQGFRSAQSTLELQVQQTARVDFTLQVGDVGQTVEVSAAAASLNTDDATVGTVIETRRITELPLNGRNYLQLIALSPNVTAGFASPGQAANRQGGTRAAQTFSIAGQRGTFNHYTLDGIENTDVNFNLYIILPSVDALQEFKVQTGVYPAEFGREAGQVNVSTKPGSNQFHGALFEFLRNDQLDAKQYDFFGANAKKNPFKWNQYGFTLGGPVWIPKIFNGQNKLFFMANYEGFRVRQANNSVYSVPTDQARSGDFSYLLASGNQLYDPASKKLVNGVVTGTPFLNNQIPSSRFDPVTQKLFQFLPHANLPGQTNNYQTSLANPIDKDQFNLRIDFNESSNSNWFGRYSTTDENTLSQGEYLNGTTVISKAQQYLLSNSRVLSSTKVNEFRFGVNVFKNDSGVELAGKRDVVDELGIPGLTNPNPALWGIPRLWQFTDVSQFGNDSSGPFLVRDTTFQIIDNFSWTLGRHSVRFGAEIRRDRYNQSGNEFARGSFEFNGTATKNPITNAGGESIADFLLGYCSKCEAAVSLAFAQFRSTGQYYYVDDTWRLSPKLTITAGLRWEYTSPWKDKSQNVSNIYEPFFPSTANVTDPSLQPVIVRAGNGDFYQNKSIRYQAPILVARDGRLGEALVHPDYHDWAPRFGIAYSPTTKWSFRTGFGIFYSQDAANTRFDLARNFGGRVTKVSDPNVPNLMVDNFIGASSGTVVNLPLSGQVQAIKPNLPTSYTMQYLFNVQRELNANTVIELGFDGNQGRHLGGLQNLNAPIPGTVGNPASRSPFPQFGIIQTLANEGVSNYNALGVKFTRRFKAGLTYLASYTWSKSLDTTSANRGTSNDILPQNSRCLKCEYGYSAFDTPQRLVTSVLYELPFGRGKQFIGNSNAIVNQVVGGWQLGSIVTWQSGHALNTNAGSDIPGTGGFGEPRLNATGISPNSSNPTSGTWFNPLAFSLPAPGTFGNISRNRLRGPSSIDWDFSAFKNFRVTEGRYLELRFESFNFANHPNLGDPNLNWGSTNPNRPSSSFLSITNTAIPMRQMQVALKFVF